MFLQLFFSTLAIIIGMVAVGQIIVKLAEGKKK